ncbi:MAG: hypothetical protein JO273_03945 [Methylobacteriaceae bacterium]|nr:hypothetical protein [Methylobacteriaceae bacterium]
MKRLLAALAALFVAVAPSPAAVINPPGLQPNANLADLLSAPAARGNLGIPLRAYSSMDAQFSAKGDARQAWATASITGGQAVLTIGAQVTSTSNVTCTLGGQTLTVAGAPFTGVQMIGQPITVTGPGGALLRSTITAYISSTQVGIADPCPFALSASSQTVTIGLGFAATDVGKAILVPGAGAAGASLATTIAGFTSATQVSLGANASTTLTSAQSLITYGTDDSAALNAAITAALARGDRYLYVPNAHYVPSLSALVAYVVPIGEGKLLGAAYRRYVIPTTAPLPGPPARTIGRERLSAFRAASSPVVVVAGDSIWQTSNNPALAMEPQPWLQKAIGDANTDKTAITFYSRAVGGQTYANLDTTPSVFPAWDTVHATPWLGTAAATGYIYALNPDLLILGFQNNDSIGLSLSAFLDVQSKIDGWAKVPDRIIATHWTMGLVSAAGATPNNNDYAAMFLRTYAQMRGFGLLDFHRQGTKLRDGYDPVGMSLVSVPGFNDTTFWRLSLPYTAPFSATGYEMSFADVTSQSGPSFWTHYGNEFQFTLSQNADNVFRIGYDNTADSTGRTGSGNLYYQCDIGAAYPGAGCRGGTVPSALTNVSITSGANSLTTSSNIFVAGDDGKQITVPGAGASGVYLVGYMHYISATNVTLFSNAGLTTALNAGTTLAASNQVILRGNPKINTGLNVSSDATGHSVFGISVVGDMVTAWWQDQDAQVFFRGPAVRFGGTFSPVITASASFPLAFRTFGNTLQCFAEAPALSQPSLTDPEVNGPAIDSPISNLPYIGASGGNGNNHPTQLAILRIVLPVLQAQSWNAQ